MDIKALLDVQQEKNKSIIINPELDVYKLFARKHLEMYTKLSSLADATNCYKYWLDNEDTLNNELIFKKYLSGLGQILTLGLDRGYTDINEVDIETSDYCLSDQFLHIYIDVNDLIISPSEDHFITLLQDYFSLGLSLGYTLDKIKEAFLSLI